MQTAPKALHCTEIHIFFCAKVLLPKTCADVCEHICGWLMALYERDVFQNTSPITMDFIRKVQFFNMLRDIRKGMAILPLLLGQTYIIMMKWEPFAKLVREMTSYDPAHEIRKLSHANHDPENILRGWVVMTHPDNTCKCILEEIRELILLLDPALDPHCGKKY